MTGTDPEPAPESRGFLRSAGTVSGLTLFSRVLGMLRDMATAHLLGAGLVSDALTYAWTLPNAFRRLFGEGALGSALIPALTHAQEQGGREAVRSLSRQVVSTLALALTALVAGLVLLIQLAATLFPEWLGAERAALTLDFTQLLLPYMIVVCVLAQFMATLHVLGEFALPAASPALLNLIWIGGALAAGIWGPELAGAGEDPRRVQGLMIIGSIFVASLLQLAWHLPRLKALGVGFAPVRPRLSPELRGVLAMMTPMLVGMGAAQLNILADRTIAQVALPEGGTTHLYYGMRLMQFPLGLVSVALTTTVFPALTRMMARGETTHALGAARVALRTNLLLSGAAAAGLLALAHPIVELIFESGKFGPEDTGLTSLALIGYAVGIPCAGTVMLLTRASYAGGDVVSPARIGLIMVVVNLGLDLALVGPLGELGLALATSLASLVMVGLLLRTVAPRFESSPFALLGGALRPLLVAVVMGLVVAVLDRELLAGRDVALRVPLGSLAGLAVFGLLAPRLCPAAWTEVLSLLPGRRR